MGQDTFPENELYEALGYLAHPYVEMHYDVQVPPKKREEFESQYHELTGEQCCKPGRGSGGYSVLGENVDKRSVQYRFSYSPVGAVPPLLKKLSTHKGVSDDKKRISNKALVLAMFKSGFVFGLRFSRDKILSKISPAHHIRFEFGYASVLIGEASVDFSQFKDGFSSVHAEPADTFSLFDKASKRTVSSRIGRNSAFRRYVLSAYDNQCCLCLGALMDTYGVREVEAAHIVPKKFRGSDDVRNGLALCRKHHWAYDHGLFGIEHDYSVVVPAKVSAISDNVSLVKYRKSFIKVPRTELAPDSQALLWHRENILAK